jgi:hypothetical protein
MVARQRVGHLIEPIEDPRLLAFGDTDAIVLHLDHDPGSRGRGRPRGFDDPSIAAIERAGRPQLSADIDLAAFRRKLNRIGDQM